MNVKCMLRNKNLAIHMMDNRDGVAKLVEKGDTVLFLDYSTSIDDSAMEKCFTDFDGVVVFPGPVEGVDWDQFKRKTLEDSKEPVSQRALKFDVDVGADPSAFVVGGNKFHRKLRDKKLKFPTRDTLAKLKAHDLHPVIHSASTVTRTFPHECLGNILEVSGVRLDP
jgi:hypothetical protein